MKNYLLLCMKCGNDDCQIYSDESQEVFIECLECDNKEEQC